MTVTSDSQVFLDVSELLFDNEDSYELYSALKEHGLEESYQALMIENELCRGLFDLASDELAMRAGLPQPRYRRALDALALSQLTLARGRILDLIEDESVYGFEAVRSVARQAASEQRAAYDELRAWIDTPLGTPAPVTH